jgi:hypothetical protein
MGVTLVDLFAFGNRAGPALPRANQDLYPDAADMVGPESPPLPNGKSLFADPVSAPLTGHYYRLPHGTMLPEGLAITADGNDVVSGSSHPPGHHTLYPEIVMRFDQFVALYVQLPWQYEGRK